MSAIKFFYRPNRLTLILFLVFGVYLSGNSQETALKTDGIKNKTLYKAIYEGRFIDIPYDRLDNEFALVFEGYLQAFSEICGQYLPGAKVELTSRECVREVPNVDLDGNSYGTNCLEYKDVGTGVYVSPFMSAVRTNYLKQRKNNLESTLSGAMDALNLLKLKSLSKTDAQKMLELNRCKSKTIDLFETNIINYLSGTPSVQEKNGDVTNEVVDVYAVVPFVDQNYIKLVRALILEDSKKWFFYKYLDVQSPTVVTERDASNRPAEIVSKYLYLSGSERFTGSIRITLKDGKPDCLYFWDNKNKCKPANRKVVSTYIRGGYAKL